MNIQMTATQNVQDLGICILAMVKELETKFINYHKDAYGVEVYGLQDNDNIVLLQDNDNVIGYVSWDYENGDTILHNIFIDDMYRGLGLSTKLFNIVKENTKNNLLLCCDDRNLSAIKFYKKMGMIEKNIHQKLYSL